MTILGGMGGKGPGGGPAAGGQGRAFPTSPSATSSARCSGASSRCSWSSRPTGASPARPSRPRSRRSRARWRARSRSSRSTSTSRRSSRSSCACRACPPSWCVAEGRIQDARRRRHPQEEDAGDGRALPAARGRRAQGGRAGAAARAGGAVVPIDTRDAGAFARAHLPGAVNMPIEEIESRLAELHMLHGAAGALLPLGRQDEGGGREARRAGDAGGVPRGRPARAGRPRGYLSSGSRATAVWGRSGGQVAVS